MKYKTIDSLVKGIAAQEKLALARAISVVENNRTGKEELIAALYPKLGRAHRVGIAGPPGVGKSTLTLQIAKACRNNGMTVGIVAVDPTSPFTGGALLGDRIRMTELFNDPGVFIRSMATRGSMGGLAIAATEAADVLDAAGKDIVIFETVGIGQTELDVAEASDTVLLILAPESGDGVQALKAGFMEIADLFIVNKSDRDGADKTVVELESVLSLRPEAEWSIPVLQTIASENQGLEETTAKIHEHYSYLSSKGLLEDLRKDRLQKRIRTMVRTMLREVFWTETRLSKLERLVEASGGKCSPYNIARELLDSFMKSDSGSD